MTEKDFLSDILEGINFLKEELHDLKNQVQGLKTSGGVSSSGGGSGRKKPLPEAVCRKQGDQFVWEVPEDAPRAKCRDCNQEIVWVSSRRGKACPIDPPNDQGIGISHQDTCPNRPGRKPEASGGADWSENVPF